ncbi:MAG TPA: hypothetical protein VNM90_24545 [Haliangium sp.]|nr:hypothetical protein [Haliangium sp.]
MRSCCSDSATRRLHRLPWAVALAALALGTCSSLDNIEVPVTANATIPRRSVLDELLGNLSFAGFEGFDISQSQQFENQGYSKDQVDSVHMLEMTLTIRSPAGANFDFLDSIRFYAEADGLDRVLVAELDPVPQGASTLVLDVDSSVELQPYVIAPEMTLTTEATGVRPAEETMVEAEAIFDVDVNVTGACR